MFNYEPIFNYLYDLDDLLNLVYSESDINKLMYGTIVSGAFKSLTDEFSVPTDTTIHSTEVNKLWCEYIVPTHIIDSILISRKEISNLQVSDFKTFMRLFIAKVRETYPKYKTLIDKFASAESHLMDTINSTVTITNNLTNTNTGTVTNKSRFNDAPQNGGLFEDDTYSSTYTGTLQDNNLTNTNTGTVTTTNESDLTSKMARLEEIRKDWKNVYSLWSNEFKDLFIIR